MVVIPLRSSAALCITMCWRVTWALRLGIPTVHHSTGFHFTAASRQGIAGVCGVSSREGCDAMQSAWTQRRRRCAAAGMFCTEEEAGLKTGL